MMVTAEKREAELYESIRALNVPSQDIRRRMDSCASVTSEITALKRGCAQVGTKVFDAEAVKETLLQLLQRDDARSVYGSTVSRAERDSQQGTHMSVKRAEAAARLAAKRAELKREKEISAQRKEVLVQQERLKMLEEQRDLEVMEAEYFVYAEVESRLNAEIGDTKERSTLPPCQHPLQHNNPSCIKVSQETLAQPWSEKELGTKVDEVLLVKALKESLMMTKLPAPEPFTFTGDPLKFTETNYTTPAQRLFYLKRYISGDALSVLEGTFYRIDEDAYTQAWDALIKRYGHPFVVERAFRAKLSNWPKIRPKGSLKLSEFSDFLISCKNSMPHVVGLEVLDDCEENQKLLQFLQQLDERVQHNKEGHVEMPLPFRERPQLLNNKQHAVHLKHLKRKLEKSPKYREDYLRFMNSVFKVGDAKDADATPKEGNTWYIPHHGNNS
ncbi:uncharacterized protein [Chanodichthys erythropterus]|uniref:uncharacterized protein n=1 Tax=Chanodichthys erythropterus TaxID=933992 RepID=UPI00351DB5E3